jgi:hypothetical protein
MIREPSGCGGIVATTNVCMGAVVAGAVVWQERSCSGSGNGILSPCF